MRMIRKYNDYFKNRNIDLEMNAAGYFPFEAGKQRPSNETSRYNRFQAEKMAAADTVGAFSATNSVALGARPD